MTLQDHPDYRTLLERLFEWRREILSRMARWDEYATLPSYPRQDLAREPGVTVRVDGFLGTHNTDTVSDVYFRVADAAKGVCETGAIPFPAEPVDEPTLAELRSRFPLAEVAGDGDDVSKAVRLRDWIKSLFRHLTPFRMPEWNGLLILDRGSRGVENFICVHYSVALVQSCLAIGMQARMVNLHRGIADNYVIGDEAVADPPVDEHVVIEVWSAELGKWVMMDTDFDCHYERGGVAMSAWDIHNAFIDGELDAVVCRRGPHSMSFNAYGERLPDEDRFFAETLPSYYAHVSVLMRNTFLSDPDGPVTVAHLTDARTAPILWHRGSDLRLQPHLMGPVVVAGPYQDTTPILTDGNLRTGWASSDAETGHWAEVTLPGPRVLGRVVLHWPEYALYYRASQQYRIEARIDGAWRTVAEVAQPVEAPYSLHDLDAVVVTAVRVVQPAGGGFREHPNRLWLNQVELYAPRSA
ncbi:discoidin domain-containing protein [Dactylosporangium sucinum]|uniref:F5/8 type C domain-containing protein n=1 Tax=Dactylosporangium sucinum TaxID=1424081 RepID=A0A917SXP0_9ACTN|nr:discoidin domain-containing protein [Dactylosporangium sucinum]GGM02898.1 hypothetical protein GCM10007977_000370 [Dactylosporangium sucinum]